MPCNSGMGVGDLQGLTTRSELERLTRVSCQIMKAIESAGIQLDLDGEAAAWWQQHKAIDEARLRREQEQAEQERIRLEEIAKLTPEERRALGLRE